MEYKYRCKGCGKTPQELIEYNDLAIAMGYSSPEEAMMKESSTFNKETGEFYCTRCFLKKYMRK